MSRVAITPGEPIQMVGYVVRNHLSEGAESEIWAKALALEDDREGRVVVVTAELTFLPRRLAADVAGAIARRTGLTRERILLNVSHTHASPAVMGANPDVAVVYGLAGERLEVVERYTARVAEAMTRVAVEALERLEPATLSYGEGSAAFGMNRRVVTESGVKFGRTPEGPRDPAVPVLAVRDKRGTLMAALFGYAAHATTLGSNNYRISGDYPGFAQAAVEQANPGATAIFLTLCGGDQKPDPDGTFELARQHGKALAAAVEHTLGAKMTTLGSTMRVGWRTRELAFENYSRERFEALAADANPFRARYGQLMLQALEEGRAPRSYSYPVQAIRFGQELTLLALGGEVVVDYALQIKKDFPNERLIVAAYSNDVMAYIPTARVLAEGGHEGGTSMIPYNQPAPWAPDVERRVMAAVRDALESVGVGGPRR